MQNLYTRGLEITEVVASLIWDKAYSSRRYSDGVRERQTLGCFTHISPLSGQVLQRRNGNCSLDRPSEADHGL